MQFLRLWSFGKLALACTGWIVLCALVTLAWGLFRLRASFDASAGSGGIGAVSGGFSELALWMCVVPVVGLVVAWVLARWL